MSTHIARKVTTGLITLALAGTGSAILATTASAAPVDTIAVAANAGTRFINSPDRFANVRSGPGTNFKVIGKLWQCTAVKVVCVKGGWSQLSDGGWVANWLLSSSPVKCKLPDTGCKPSCPSKPCGTPCSPCGKPSCPPPAPRCLFRVVVAPKCVAQCSSGEREARALAAKIGGGAFVRVVDGNWVVQVGAFANRDNAVARAARFGGTVLPCS